MPFSRLLALIAVLTLVPTLARAECSIVRGNGSVNLIVGQSASTCLAGAELRAAFLAEIKQAVAVAADASASTTPPESRRFRPALRTPGSADGADGNAEQRYYGQR